jgi:hypothetical protein
MVGFYEEMQAVADDILGEYKQGVIQLVKVTPGVADPQTPWIPGLEQMVTYDLKAVAKPIDRRFVDGTLLVSTDVEVITAVTATLNGAPSPVDPHMEDRVLVDGQPRAIKKIRRIPEAGTVVAYSIFVAG